MEKKLLNLTDIIALGLGGAIGSGIFVMLGMGIALTGKSVIIAVSAGVILMLFANFYQIIMSSMFVFKGGSYEMMSIAMPTLVAGTNGMFVILQCSALAMLGIAMVEYASIVFPVLAAYTKPLAILAISLMFASTYKGSKFVATLNKIMTIVLAIAIVTFVICGLPNVGAGYFTGDDFFLDGFSGLLAAFSIMSFACAGTTAPVALSAATKNPKKTVPIGVLLVCLLLAVIYGSMAYVAAGVLPVDVVAGESLAIVSAEFLSYWPWVLFVLGGAVFAIATSALSGVAGYRYPLLKLANDGWLPEAFKKQNKDGYPYIIMLTLYAVSVLPIILNFSFDTIVSLAMIPTLLSCAYMNYYILKCVKLYPKQWEESVFHMPYPALLILAIFAILCDFVVIFNLLLLLGAIGMVLVIFVIVACVIVAFVRIKQGKIDTNMREAAIMALEEQIAQVD